jgi:RHS Repeat
MGSLLDLTPPATVTDPLSHTTTFGYDAKGNLTTITNCPVRLSDKGILGQLAGSFSANELVSSR